MKIINNPTQDFHLHSLNFSDGLNTIDEIVKFAEQIGLTKIAITDHSTAVQNPQDICRKHSRFTLKRWKNIFNQVEVSFGVEGDLLNEYGDVCLDYFGTDAEVVILSAHSVVYGGDFSKINQAYDLAIKRYGEKIKFLGHPCAKYFEQYLDIRELIKLANDHGIPMEFNCANFFRNRTNLANMEKMFEFADQIIVNTDSHTVTEMVELSHAGWDYLKKQGLI